MQVRCFLKEKTPQTSKSPCNFLYFFCSGEAANNPPLHAQTRPSGQRQRSGEPGCSGVTPGAGPGQAAGSDLRHRAARPKELVVIGW